ncbi:MAG: tRNA pseudouridine(55) synthase TruB [Bacilli bacterium]|nr:tRNA pseudouridine(55) synthase TruB [Bacilli bacterium]
MNGILIIDKEKDYTSRDVVNIVGKALNTRKIGHTGTLDPIATGVLVLCIGEATKLVELVTADEKEYVAEVILGVSTDSLDITGNVLEENDSLIEKKQIEEVLNKFKGKYEQEVPKYSAVKIKGKKLYEYARNNEEVVLPKREVNIKEIELLNYKQENNKTIFSFRCVVSKGTYIRSLIRDIASSLNTIGVMANLKRIRQGKFNIKESYTISDIKNGNYKLIDIGDVLNCKRVTVTKELEVKIRNGVLVPNIYETDIVLFINENKELISLYKKYDKDESLLKPWKMFRGGIK